ncbi:MAG TPA: PDZ domain-containing protein [Pirellulaceae bacterium]|nr:PDZ domain-containing protein [Pirellulaceae bacterium]
MHRISLIGAALAAFLASGSLALGQGLLDKVEKALDRGAAPPAASPPAADDGTPPAAALDDLPPPAPEAKSGYLGVGLEVQPSGGIVVTEVGEESPAAKAGLKVGDKITTVNRAIVEDIEELSTVMETVPPGGKLTLGVVRDGRALTIVATLAEPPEESAPAASEPGGLDSPLGPGAGDLPAPATPPDEPRAGDTSGRPSLGITVVTFNEQTRRRSDVPARNGALITQIRPQSPADRAGLPIGGVIVAYEGQRIDTADELVAAIAASRPGDEVEISYYQGSSLSRKDVRLVSAADPSLLAPGAGGALGDRPLLNRVERAIEGLTRPGGAGGLFADGAREVPADPEMTLREEIEALHARIETLEMRVSELEAKLAAARPAPDADAAPAIDPPAVPPAADEGAKALRPPTRRPSTTVPKLKIGDE